MASTILYNVDSGGELCLGHKFDHKKNVVEFTGMALTSTANTMYFKLQTNSNNWLIPLANMQWLVTQPMTLNAGEFRGQLVEIAPDNALIANSNTFKVTVRRSIAMGDDYEVDDPSLDLIATQMTTLYNTVYALNADLEAKRASGYWKGEKGDPYDHSEEFTQLAAQVRSDAQSSASNASSTATSSSSAAAARDTAITAKNEAVSAKDAAQSSATSAFTSKTNALVSEQNAKTSETNAKTSENEAKKYATQASQVFTIAGGASFVMNEDNSVTLKITKS